MGNRGGGWEGDSFVTCIKSCFIVNDLYINIVMKLISAYNKVTNLIYKHLIYLVYYFFITLLL